MSRIKAAFQPNVPVDRLRAEACLLAIGDHQRRLLRLETELNDRLAAAKDEASRQAEPLRAELKSLTEGLRVYCERERTALTQNGATKTHRFDNGEVSWRARPPKVSIKGGVEAAIDAVKRLKLLQFLRTKEELNREAMLDDAANAAKVPGISIGSAGEDFIVKPFATQLEAVS